MLKQSKINRAVSLLLLLCSIGFSQIPRLIAYQGLLTDSKGNPRPDGKYFISFDLFSDSSGGTSLWNQSETLLVYKGMFGTLLGSKTLLNLPFNKQYWLSVSVDGKELSPRTRLASVAYCFRADTANVAIKANTAKKADTAAFVPNVAASNHSHSSLDASDGDPKNALVLDANGNVGIGTSYPQRTLEVAGRAFIGGKFSDKGDMCDYSLITAPASYTNSVLSVRHDIASGFTNSIIEVGIIQSSSDQFYLQRWWTGDGTDNPYNYLQAYIKGDGSACFNRDVEIYSENYGIILKSPDGSRWRITIDNSGIIQRTKL